MIQSIELQNNSWSKITLKAQICTLIYILVRIYQLHWSKSPLMQNNPNTKNVKKGSVTLLLKVFATLKRIASNEYFSFS